MKTYSMSVVFFLGILTAIAPAGSIVQVSAHAGVHAQEIQSGVAAYVNDSGATGAEASAVSVGIGTVQVLSKLSVANSDDHTVVLSFDQQRNVSTGARPSAAFNTAGTTNAFWITVSSAKDFTLTTTWAATCTGYVWGMPYVDLYNGSTYLARLFDSWADKPNPAGTRNDLIAGQPGEQTFRIPMTGNSYASVPVSSQQNDRVMGTITLQFTFPPKDNQAITFPAIPDQVITSVVTLSATASSGLTVSYSATGPAVLNGNTLSFNGTGTVRIVASQAGNANWNAASSLTNTFNVTKASQAALVFNPVSPQVYLTTNLLSVSGGSGTGALSYAVASGPGEIMSGTLLAIRSGTGMVEVTATKAADALYNVHTMTALVAAARASQVITNFMPTGGSAFSTTSTVGLSATAASGLPVTFAIGSGLANISGGTNLTFTGAGAVSIVASQPGDTNWNAAPSLTNTLNVAKATATVTLNNLSQTYDSTPRVVTASSVPSLPSILLTYNGDATAPVNAGTYTVIGTVNHALYAGAATGTLTIAKANQNITFPVIPDQFTKSQVSLAAVASSGLPVTFVVVSGPAQILTGNVLTFTGVGAVTVAAAQLGDANWNAASPIANMFNVTRAIAPIVGIPNADFDGDGLADPATYDENTGNWKIMMSASGYATMNLPGLLGGPGWVAAVGDYDGDGLSDPAVFQDTTGDWILMKSGSGYAQLHVYALLGAPGWAPDSANFTGDRVWEFTVYQEATGNWTFKLGGMVGALEIYKYNLIGGPGYSPVSADFDGDGYADPVVYNRANGTWKLLLSGAGYFPLTLPNFLGGPGWSAVPGDYDGDGLTDPAVRKDDGSIWRIMLSRIGYFTIDVPLGL